MKKIKFNPTQEQFINETLEAWYSQWKTKITRDSRQLHNLDIATKTLRAMLFPEETCIKDATEVEPVSQ